MAFNMIAHYAGLYKGDKELDKLERFSFDNIRICFLLIIIAHIFQGFVAKMLHKKGNKSAIKSRK